MTDTRSRILKASPAPDRRARPIATILCALLILGGCAAASGDAAGDGGAGDPTAAESSGFLDATTIHELSVVVDPAEYEALVETYATTGEKDWITAEVTIDGHSYTQAGLRLKGNSSLFGLGSARAAGPGGEASADDPATLPWLIRLDKYVDGQNHQGISDLVVRSNNSDTAMNEAVALELLELAGLASQDAACVAFSVNGSDEVLRLVVEHPDDVWLDDAFDDSGVLYKAESTGDYSYRGEDPNAYDEVFDLEAGEANGDLTPLIEFLEFINNADDATFTTELVERLDVDAFATYLAMQELIDNFDDIDGPGNNSYLYYDVATEMFTVVPWDHNLAFGGLDAGGAPPGGPPDAGPPQGSDPGEIPERNPGQTLEIPTDEEPTPPPGGGARPAFDPSRAGPGQGGADGSNILVERFLANDEWRARYAEKLEHLRTSLYETGVADAILETWTNLLTTQAGAMVDEDVITSEADAIAAYFS